MRDDDHGTSSQLQPDNLTLKLKSYDQKSFQSKYSDEEILRETTFELYAHGSAYTGTIRYGICLWRRP